VEFETSSELLKRTSAPPNTELALPLTLFRVKLPNETPLMLAFPLGDDVSVVMVVPSKDKPIVTVSAFAAVPHRRSATAVPAASVFLSYKLMMVLLTYF
jgi:hypothetical protein